MKRREFDVKFMWLDQGFNVGWEHSQLGQLPRGQNTEMKLTELAGGDRVVSAEHWEELMQIIDTVDRGYLDLSRWVLEVEEEQG